MANEAAEPREERTVVPPAASPGTGLEERKPWFRDAGEYIASRSTRMGLPTEVNSKIITDGKRFDASLGKRIPLLTFGEESLTSGWVFGIDGGMLASLKRFKQNGRLTFATNTFDGYFGAFLGYADSGWHILVRTAHLSAHLVDNSPQILNPVGYSQFWNELILGKSIPDVSGPSNWDLVIQGSVGMNNTSTPVAKQPRASLGMTLGYCLSGADSLALIASADALRAGVQGQSETYAFFAGVGFLNRPESTHRPFRMGVAHYTGSDYRNQFYRHKQDWTSFEISAEL